ncbi:MAG: tetratricopeptide repeat protein [Candidatus Gracilibacteria bacterium]|jgi:Flp pilus assembly protein TadD|nr:tetratricopeptide repeat protein [Candidatus Gracilibacteria bacterium]
MKKSLLLVILFILASCGADVSNSDIGANIIDNTQQVDASAKTGRNYTGGSKEENAKIWKDRGIKLLDEERYEEAKKAFDKASDLVPHDLIIASYRQMAEDAIRKKNEKTK